MLHTDKESRNSTNKSRNKKSGNLKANNLKAVSKQKSKRQKNGKLELAGLKKKLLEADNFNIITNSWVINSIWPLKNLKD
jgi:hypothetical protein